MRVEAVELLGAVAVRERPLGYLRVVTDDGQEVHLSTAQAAAVVTALLADGQAHAAWLHGTTDARARRA